MLQYPVVRKRIGPRHFFGGEESWGRRKWKVWISKLDYKVIAVGCQLHLQPERVRYLKIKKT